MKTIMTVLAALALTTGMAVAENADGGCIKDQTNTSTSETPAIPADQVDA